MRDDPTRSMAVFCDFENIALGARDARFTKFDMASVLERLLLRGNIVVRKAYCDWERYKEYKRPMHEASFEMIEIPHVRQSGKNSADIRMVVDALDLCYTKPHLDTFVLISGDSDFSPLVSKLRENDRLVVGVGVRQSTSDLLSAICDEFIFYDDLVREKEQPKRRRKRSAAKGKTDAQTAGRTEEQPAEATTSEDKAADQAIDWVVEIASALIEEPRRRGEGLGAPWSSRPCVAGIPASTSAPTASPTSARCWRRPRPGARWNSSRIRNPAATSSSTRPT
ncbi:MAG: NYN domain-containing protein [Gammaproteobacteria bacterium]|nr:NYN domain-containing protein [Gammaproteobacteria bacterium]